MKVTGLWVFPVKSCKGIPVNSALHTATGKANKLS